MNNQQHSNPRILFVISGDIWAGAEVQVYNLVVGLSKLKYDVRTVVFNEGKLCESLKKTGVPVHVVDENYHSGFQLFYKLIALIREQQPDVLHTHGFKENILASFANAFSIRAGCIRTLHGDVETKIPLGRLDKLFTRFLDNFAGRYLQDRVIVVSSQLRDKYAGIYGKDKVCVIKNTINIGQVEEESLRPIEEEYSSNFFKIAIVGRLVPLKRHSFIISSMPELVRRCGDKIRLYIFGDGPEKKNLQELIASAKVEDNVRLMGNLQPFYPHFKNMDLLVMPSDQEGLPMTLLEALVLKVPIIAHATGGIPELLLDGELGTLVKDHTESAYLEAIVDLMRNMELATTRALNGHQYAREKYDIASSLDNYEEVYRSLIRDDN